MELIDIGVNLTHESFVHDLPDVLHRAERSGVHRMVVTGTSVASTEGALALRAVHPHRLFATAGLHPHHASEYDTATHAALRELARQPGIVAVGECGLDFHRNLSPRDAQLKAFAGQLELAVELQLPVFLHQRDAHADFMAVLRDYLPRLKDAIAHCFTGQRNEMEECLEANLAIGITGWICDERRGQHLLPLVPLIPAHRLMIETDAPYLLPRTVKPQPSHRRNEPMYLAHIVEELARDRGESTETTAATTTSSARAFFGLPIAA